MPASEQQLHSLHGVPRPCAQLAKDRPLKILVLSMEPPKVPGSGGEVRSFHFVKSLAESSEVTLVSLGGGEGRMVHPDSIPMCRRIIEPHPDRGNDASAKKPKPSRFQSWLRTIAALAFPWRHDWNEFLSYCDQHCPRTPAPRDARTKASRRILVAFLRLEFRIVARLFSLPPMGVRCLNDAFKSVWPRVFEALKRDEFDVVWFEHSTTYPFAQAVLQEMNKPLLVCNAHNVESTLQDRFSHLSTTPAEAGYWRAQGRLFKRLETAAFNACDLVFTCSLEDKQTATALAPATEILVIGNGVDTQYFRPAVPTRRSPTPMLLFTGSFGYGPNQDALGFFVRDIFPLIKKERPDCRFLFAGAKASSALSELGYVDSNIECVSSPPDIRPCFERSWIFVVPLRAGGGTRLKILEAMAMELPIVSTAIGAEGIPCQDGEHILLADSPSDFANAVLRLLADEKLRLQLSNEAASWVRKNYDWKDLCESAVNSLRQQYEPTLAAASRKAVNV